MPTTTSRTRPVNALGSAAVILTLLLSGGCNELNVPDFNNLDLGDLETNPTPAKIAQAAQGMLIGARVQIGEQNGYVSLLGILGRESYNFDPADPRFITEMLIGPLDGGSPAFGGNLFEIPYRNIRNGNTLLGAVDAVAGLTDEQREATRGFVKTIQALDYLEVINTRDDLGAPIDVNQDPTSEPAPIATKDQVFDHIVQLLDEGSAHLQAGGASFPFGLSDGFANFATPASFLTFNRALLARVEVYRGNYAAALEALDASFLDPDAPLTFGAYHSYSTRSGDLQNQLFDPTGRAILAHPSIITDAQLRPDGSLDARTSKVTQLDEPRTVQGITTDLVFTIYQSNIDPIPIIRNEELILLRAEANLGLDNLTAALDDIDFIRERSGGLAAYSGPVTQSALLDELLYNKRYSLLFEGGHRWIDARRYGRLDELPLAVPTHHVLGRFPFPEAECLARAQAPPEGCG
ncbi:MAG TPA: RagB/SusD family nutrient uptake outer membrane protein [Gemmatimonadaceae bacterium]|nr:RagB/SusD family nutrient uptake outer membrane protein [Gemmatimonadaceae bacterium]